MSLIGLKEGIFLMETQEDSGLACSGFQGWDPYMPSIPSTFQATNGQLAVSQAASH